MTLSLKPFQKSAVDTIVSVIQDTAIKIVKAPRQREAIAKAQGSVLLQAPTGSGKTLMLSRSLEAITGTLPMKIVWFWFAPFSGLVTQTEDAIKAHATTLRVRDPKSERDPQLCEDGDVFVATWASVAARNKDARKTRTDSEDTPSIDTLVSALKADGWMIGAVIDEAHVNFGASAQQAMDFYINALAPDITLMATATPKDKQLEDFRELVGIERVNLIAVSREEVVRAKLNKQGVKAVYFKADQKDAALIDFDEVALQSGLQRHNLIKQELASAGINLTPLMLVQVESKEGSVDRAKEYLMQLGVPEEAIAVHTADEPDPYLHTIAYDETKEVLIFKLAVATGFDAPRAWTLVSMRRARGVEFGLQIIGRIMRVHSSLQKLTKVSERLNYGYVFLSNPDVQTGLTAAADDIKALVNEISTVTDGVNIIEIRDGKAAIINSEGGFAELFDPPKKLPAQYTSLDEETQESGVSIPLLQAQWQLDHLFDNVPGFAEDGATFSPAETLTTHVPVKKPAWVSYDLHSDIKFPRRSDREVMPTAAEITNLIECIAGRIQYDDRVINLLMKNKSKVEVTEEELFEHIKEFRSETFTLSDARIRQVSQLSFRFNDHLDERALKLALVERLKTEVEKRGIDMPDERILRRTVDLAALAYPDMLPDACKLCMSQGVKVIQAEEIPAKYYGPSELPKSAKNLYSVIPHDILTNTWETRFAEMLDADSTGTIMWWLRNVPRQPWSVSIVRPSGKYYYPDFIVAVMGAKSKDQIKLAEIKGMIGEADSEEKARTDHLSYGSALMLHWDTKTEQWIKVEYREDIRRNVLGEIFKLDDLRW
ncbi:MAG: DEAD/DEAH box helicase [Candidatus Moraniibacteriota bacterium]|nr:MAG: DEAD/DEAH box helicase [Candidatus Moranbacteria bacterium]